MLPYEPEVYPWNESLWQTLNQQSERSNHALLFCGDSGLGKQALAMSYAYQVMTGLAQGERSEEPTQAVNLFNAGTHPDFHVIMPEMLLAEDLVSLYARRYIDDHSGKAKRSTTIEQIRRLSDKLTTHAHISENRVILVLAAELLNRNASNALLKSLEEPPANTLFLLVSDEPSRLPKTIRSRCSLLHFRAPEKQQAIDWLQLQNIDAAQIENSLALADGSPLRAIKMQQDGYMDTVKAIFSDANGLWGRRKSPIEVAKNWQSLDGQIVVSVLQKMLADLLRLSLTNDANNLFFPVQKNWLLQTSGKLATSRIVETIDALNQAKKMLLTTVDQLLVLETLSIRFHALPK